MITHFRRHLQAALLALQFLTQLPVRLRTLPDGATQSLAPLYYPVVGLLIGALLVLLVWAGRALALPDAVLAALLLTVWCGLTGALHLDGLADSADGWMGGLGDRTRTLDIMRDPCIGASGAVVLGLQLLLKWSALAALLALPAAAIMTTLLLAPLIGRAAALLLLATTPYARPGGIATELLAQLPRVAVYRLCGILGLLLLALHPFWLLAPLLLLWGLRQMMLRRLQGTTGDTSGALIELTETLVLVLGLILLPLPPLT